jgi:HPt (histidine-containing phosphotransfer) domain-containing protein
MTHKPPPDPALLDLFRAELETHLATLSAGVLSLEGVSSDPKNLESLMRAAHSIKGAAKIVGFDAAVQVSHQMEDCFVAAQRGQIALTSDSVDVLLRGVDALGRLGTSADAAEDDSGLTPAELEQLVAEIAAVRSGRPPVAERPATPASLPTTVPAAAAAVSQAAVHEFVSEAKEHLADVVQDLLALEQGPSESSAERIDRLFRAMHSVKGGAGFVGCQVIEELAHAMENVLEEFRQTGKTRRTARWSTHCWREPTASRRWWTTPSEATRPMSEISMRRLRQCLAKPFDAQPASPGESQRSGGVQRARRGGRHRLAACATTAVPAGAARAGSFGRQRADSRSAGRPADDAGRRVGAGAEPGAAFDRWRRIRDSSGAAAVWTL